MRWVHLPWSPALDRRQAALLKTGLELTTPSNHSPCPSPLQEAGVGRYCPHLLADYLVLAAAPPSGKSKALLHFRSPARALAAAGVGTVAAGPGTSVAAAAAAAEEEVLAGEPMSREAAAALRQGAYALYGACSAAEVHWGHDD